ncbi:DUF3604 domain-containing protein [Halieaceae bacterium IMCC8485]|uniref:DUF3604 domain-containing protein n=2 Tax=Candidatus Seongchinamella marina TaxID=2518990 RepID=A0ABT3SWU5_9GAMM|nr:DUF3604 domain-containing protein [Candidatus Seongchinamella marina]
MFGDLHVHTSFSFDSYVSSQRNGPGAAYSYAKGNPIILSDADGEQTLKAQIQRPLDFTAITDHAEFLGPINLCTQDSSKAAYWFPACIAGRSSWFIAQLLAANYWAKIGVVDDTSEKNISLICSMGNCDAAHSEAWQGIQDAAEQHYDRSSECSFTTFIGYEYTDAPNYSNLHRNVIFRNAHVTDSAISTYDTGSKNVPELWRKLRDQCIDAETGCDVLAIPHNSNLSRGLMFPDPRNEQEALDRSFFEPLVELVQHKAASECRFDRLAGAGLDTEDELCDFEQVEADNLSMLGTLYGEVRTDEARAVPLEEFGRRNMVRNTLKDGLALQASTGINPFMLGFIGSTDTHSASPGGAEENNYTGHLGRRDAGYRNVQDHFFDNPGGVDTESCLPTGTGHKNLCTVWHDPQYNSNESAFYYARVLENPSCRWSTLQCQAAGVNPFAENCAEQAEHQTAKLQGKGAIGDVFGRCCLDPATEPFYSPTIQERAWTSPIWINANKE